MSTRLTRGISCRTIYPGEAKALHVQPIFTGEDLGNFHAAVHAASIPVRESNADHWQFMGAAGFIEANFTLLFIPYHVMTTYTVNPGEQPHPPENVEQWDMLIRRLLLEFGTDGNEFYGGNPDNQAVYDVNRQTWFRVRMDRPQGLANDDTAANAGTAADTLAVNTGGGRSETGVLIDGNQPNVQGGTQRTATINGKEYTYTSTQDEPLINGTMGPMGVIRLYNAEEFLAPSASAGVNREIPSTLQSFFNLFSSGWGYMDLTHALSHQIDVPGGIGSQPGALVLACHRYDVPTVGSPDFALNWATTAAGNTPGDENMGETEAEAKEKLRALAALYGHDVERVKADLKLDASFRGDYMRSMMFGGDLMLEEPETWATNIFGDQGIYGDLANRTWLRPNGIVVGAKWAQSTLTQYDLHFNG